MHAPNVTAVTAAVDDSVWSDKPTGTSNAAAMWGRVRRSISTGDAGYALLHRNNASSPDTERAAHTARSISSKRAIPVDSNTGRPVAAAAAINSRSTISNDAILIAGASWATRKWTLSTSNADAKHARPRAAAARDSSAYQAHGVIASR